MVENGQPQFFRRLAKGFDEEDLISLIDEAEKKYHFDPDNIIAIGYISS